MLEMLWPRPLPEGGTIGICSPAGPSPRVRLDNAVAHLEERGYKVVVGPNTLKRQDVRDYLAGTVEERLSDLNGLIHDERVDLILSARGGYGCAQLLDGIDWATLRERQLGIVGYSDVTALSLGAAAQAGMITYSGIMATAGDGFGEDSLDPWSAQSFFEAVGGHSELTRLESTPAWTVHRGPDTLTARLYPVCLTLVETLLGTPYMPDLTGAILLIEDVEERLYAIDRSLTQLRLAGILDKLAGLFIGSFNGVNEEHDFLLAAEVPKLAMEFTPESVAVVSGVAYGHIPHRFTLPVGAPVSVDMNRGAFWLERV
ncbi:MAG: LD-carboxypeptidase [Armatimonas sp.]